ncbi:Protein tweety like protein 1 [Myotis brandtii]|uniref:Protein tweety homolog n=1 Tax=Myotis brandtii TaxID=109478 RepID=S7P330_MYOBR|nr:Protein tweety like protein 1 [Myotis brandtii]
MTVMSLVVLVLSWGSLGLEAATAVGLSDFCSSPDTYILNLTQEETGIDSGDPSGPVHPLDAQASVSRPAWGVVGWNGGAKLSARPVRSLKLSAPPGWAGEDEG